MTIFILLSLWETQLLYMQAQTDKHIIFSKENESLHEMEPSYNGKT